MQRVSAQIKETIVKIKSSKKDLIPAIFQRYFFHLESSLFLNRTIITIHSLSVYEGIIYSWLRRSRGGNIEHVDYQCLRGQELCVIIFFLLNACQMTSAALEGS